MANKITKKDFERMLGRLQDEDYVTSDEFYQMFNKVVDAVKQARVNSAEAITNIDKAAQKKQKELEKHFVELLNAVDKRMKKVKDGAAGKDGTTPIAGVDYPDYQEIRDFVRDQVESLPKPADVTEVITADYIKSELEALEGNDRLSFEAINGLKEEIETQFRLLDAATNKSPKFVHGGVNVSGASAATSLSALTDTTITSVDQGDVIYYNGSAWVNLGAGADGTFLKSNGASANPSWATPAGSGDVSKVGTPVDSQVGVWTGDGTIEGDTALTFDTTTDTLAIGASGKLAFGAVNVLSDAAGTTTLSNIDAIDATTETTLEAALDFQPDLAEGNFVDGDKTKLDGIETGADVTDTANVTAAGALMDSEVDADIKTLSLPASTTISAFGATLVDDADAATARTTLGVNTTANQTDSADKRFMTDAQETKLDSVESSADVTDTTNVTAAGALMDSELTDIAAVKALADASIADTDTGTSTTAFVTPDGLQGSIRNLRFVDFIVVDPATDVATGTSKVSWSAPFAGTIVQDDSNKDYFAAYTTTAGTTGTMVVDIHKGGTTIMTTNKLDIATTDLDSTLNGTQPDLTTTTFSAGDVFTIDIDAVHSGTAAKGLVVRMAVRPD